MQEPIRVTFDWNADECVKAMNWHFRASGKSRSSQYGWILVLGVVGGLMMTVPPLRPIAVIALLIAGYAGWSWWRLSAKLRKQFEDFPSIGGTRCWELTAERIETRAPTFTTSSSWGRFPSALRAPDGILLYENPAGLFHWLPASGCELGEFDRLVTLVRAQVPTFREIR